MAADFNKPLFPLLSEELRNALIEAGQVRRFSDGQMIHIHGDDRAGLSIILDGRVRFGLYGEDGAYIQAGILSEGHCFGEATLFAGIPRAYDADALGETEIVMISKDRFDQFLDATPGFAKALLVSLTSRLYESLEFADDLRTLSREARVGRYLDRALYSARFENDTIPIRQIDLAYALGLSRVSIGKALGNLQDRGVIALGYGEIRILDRDRLARRVRQKETEGIG